MYSLFAGITENQSESFNATLKRLKKWHEALVERIPLALYTSRGSITMKSSEISLSLSLSF